MGMLVYIPVIAGLAYVYVLVSPWAVVLFIGPAVAAQRFFILYRAQTNTASELARAIDKLERVNLSFATALVTALDARDHYTAGHSATVAVYARDIAKATLTFSEDERIAHLCGLLHDIGKIGVPTGVLEKQGPLSRDERSTIEMHAEVGAAILHRVEGYQEIALAVRHHHERFDGLGYPDRLQGSYIPLLSRIVSVADSYSAMVSERPYRVALTSEDAIARLLADSGSQFDPAIVEVFLGILNAADDTYAYGTHRDFAIEVAESLFTPITPAFAFSG